MNDYGLSPQQLEVIDALSSGTTMTAAAEQAGIHRNTINNWRRNLLPFQHALAQAQYDRALLYRERTEQLMDLAIKTIDEILNDPKAPASVRLKAALAIIQMASTPPPPKKQIELDIEKVVIPVHKNAQNAQPAPSAANPPTPQIVHNSAQSTSHPPNVTKKPGRNEACPCGSGNKYKRCCLGKAAAA